MFAAVFALVLVIFALGLAVAQECSKIHDIEVLLNYLCSKTSRVKRLASSIYMIYLIESGDFGNSVFMEIESLSIYSTVRLGGQIRVHRHEINRDQAMNWIRRAPNNSVIMPSGYKTDSPALLLRELLPWAHKYGLSFD